MHREGAPPVQDGACELSALHDTPKPRDVSIAREFERVHSVITFALETSIEHSEQYAQLGYPDRSTRKGFAWYVQCLSALLHAHHTTEDDLVFPYFWEKMPELPVERLIAEHQQMDPLLDEIEAALSGLAGKSVSSQNLTELHQALESMLVLWQMHIKTEEQYLTRERIDAVLDRAEHNKLRIAFLDHSRRLQRRAVPLSLLIPFTLYNLSCEERPGLAPRLARLVTRVLIPYVWKHKWAPMVTFLRAPPQLQ
jgi:hypothetical protein